MAKAEEPEVDLDLDLFNFAEVMPDETSSGEEDINLDEIFSAFEEEESAEAAANAGAEEDDGELGDDLFDDAFGPPGAEETVAAGATAAKDAPAPAKEGAAPKVPAKAAEAAEGESAAPAARSRTAKGRARAQEADEKADPALERSARRRRLVATGALAVFLALTLLNISVALVTFRSAADMPAKLESVSREMTAAALSLQAQVPEPAEPAPVERASAAPLPPEENATLARALEDIEAGSHAEARRRVYALLSVTDRSPEEKRPDLEARSLYLLARSFRAQALHAGDPR